MWAFDYEETRADERGIYKFDHERIADGQWHELNASGGAWYRIAGARLQFVAAHESMSEEECKEVLAAVASCGPLYTQWVVEAVIRREGEGFKMWDRELSGREGVAFSEFSSREFNRAYKELRRLVGEHLRKLEAES